MEEGERPVKRRMHTYECDDCGYRLRAERSPGACPACGSGLRNIGVARNL
ncbi:rubrerythrin-like domain-containing protein [Halegenticoccus tardaugens]|nr:rubrerythrin-like domain-containing protein [Halegenticoccus tardaugens]